jgi:hypothetical protein
VLERRRFTHAARRAQLRGSIAPLCLGFLTACSSRVTSVGTWVEEASSFYVEAESGELSGNFSVAEEARASAGRYLSPPGDVISDDQPGSSLARYAVSIPTTASYVIWGRIRSPGASENRFWFQVDGGTWIKWRISVGDIWYWDAFHDDTQYGQPLEFPLGAGSHDLTIANCVPGVALDRIYFTPNGDTPAGNDTPCHPPHSIELNGTCLPSCGSLGGTTCGPAACANRELLPAYDCDVCCRIAP